jgi:hypothetical protein
MTKTKKFDCVEWARESRTRIQEETKSMRLEEIEQFFHRKASQSALWRRLTHGKVNVQSANEHEQ